jgi:type IV pilus assembly protein PilA
MKQRAGLRARPSPLCGRSSVHAAAHTCSSSATVPISRVRIDPVEPLHPHSHASERGFTLVEMLVVCLIIAALAAIALPTFVRHRDGAQDAEAKSNVRNLVTHVEACAAAAEDYRSCDTVAELGTTGLPLVDGAPSADATVGVAGSTASTFTVTAQSRHASATFSIARTSGGALVHSCSGPGGGCRSGSW